MKKNSFIIFIVLLCSLITQDSWAKNAQVKKSPIKYEWKNRVYLATCPRSGNHWMRYLIEEATHIATSSVYRDHFPDPEHLRDPFPWGGYCVENGYEGQCRYAKPGEPVVIKTHFPTKSAMPFDLQPYVKTVRIVRNPVDSFYSHYTRHIEALKRNNQPLPPERIPEKTLKRQIADCRKFFIYWDLQPNVMTIRYEDLLEKPEYYLAQVLKYIGYKVTEEDVQRAVAKHPPQGGILKHLYHFTEDDRQLIREQLSSVLQKYEYDIPEEDR